MKKFECRFLVCCALLVLCAVAVKAQSVNGHNHGHVQPGEKPDESSFRLTVPDVEVVNQDGRKLRLYTDLIKGRKVVVNFIYTTCTAVCPLSGDNFARLQAQLGESMGTDVFLISITTDPENDTPARLKTWSTRFKPKAGWTFVTGDASAMNTVLLALMGEGPRRGFHNPIAFVIDDKIGGWKRTNGLEAPARLIEMLGALSATGINAEGVR